MHICILILDGCIALDLMHKMLQFHPADRITVDAALSHPYLSDYHGQVSEPCGGELFNFDFEKHEDHSEMTEEEVRALQSLAPYIYSYLSTYSNYISTLTARFASVCTRRCCCIALTRSTRVRTSPQMHPRNRSIQETSKRNMHSCRYSYKDSLFCFKQMHLFYIHTHTYSTLQHVHKKCGEHIQIICP